ncbi:hypothetical protein B0T18DRAFT_470585 [Schizothecium vesticola]|uniref:3-beta hydroxysteroid dehydrogenase/isomerase domain-containing protein n=1 Tax=Schizothecium vesticola TaxID=314040 RepID=A0AA40EI33_9PEZI|nr:hypothetical protein B0T18DRAFT_470585 [Schizothecium vesticola]
MSNPQATIPKGSWVLVTGATGNVATQVAKQFLERGYKVRGTVRDLAKASWLVTDVFKPQADRGDFELIVVPDLAADHAFDDAVKGVSAIAHVASVVTFSPDPNEVIPQTVKGATGILEAALNEPSVREFVYTSSVVAATLVVPGNTTHVDENTYNETAIELAWSKAAPEAVRGAIVYSASKAEAEKAVWEFVRQRKPHFTVNAVGPSHILGEQLHRSHLQSNGAWLKMLVDGDLSDLQNYNTLFNIDVKDVGLLHVAAVLDGEVKNKRLQAWAQGCTWNDILAILRGLYPDRKFIDDLPGQERPSVTSDFTLQIELLKKWGGQEGWRTLEQTVEDNMKSLLELEAKA